jgi:TRAP-type uncharacterized transport system fused permease subunit
VIYFIPFMFVLNPALLFGGTVAELAVALIEAVLGIWLVVCAIQAYVPWLGGAWNWLQRLLLLGGGLLIALPPVLEMLPVLEQSAAGAALGLAAALPRCVRLFRTPRAA